MVNYRQNSEIPSFMKKAERRKITFLVVFLGVVMILAYNAAKSEHWNYFGTPEEVVSESTKVLPKNAEENVLKDAEETVDKVQMKEGILPGVDPAKLEKLADKGLHYKSESDYFYSTLAAVGQTPQSEIDKAYQEYGEKSVVNNAQLRSLDDLYRGKLVKFSGDAQRVYPAKCAKQNKYGVQEYYRVWVETDSKEIQVVTVLELPEGFPGNDPEDMNEDGIVRSFHERITYTGVFYKNFLYFAGDETSMDAPDIFAKSFTWYPVIEEIEEPATVEETLPTLFRLAGIGIAVSLAFTLFVFILGKNMEANSKKKLDEIRGDGNVGFLAESNLGVSTEENLKELAETLPDEKPAWQVAQEIMEQQPEENEKTES